MHIRILKVRENEMNENNLTYKRTYKEREV